MPKSVFVGIDVACSARIALPVCFVASGSRLHVLDLPAALKAAIPRGAGNREAATEYPFRLAAAQVTNTLLDIEREMSWRIERIAIDAPAAPPEVGPRASEAHLGRDGISCFRTPERSAWPDIQQKIREHLAAGKNLATVPHANQIWMLFGFELFLALRSALNAEVIETYPNAVVRALLLTTAHKSNADGYKAQLAGIATRTGWSGGELETDLKRSVPGRRHDRLDAFIAAWVAALPTSRRRAYGEPLRPDDAIWVPA